ncbi:hypothetical protein ACTHT0_11360, partial [Neisseria sp. P0014.S006]
MARSRRGTCKLTRDEDNVSVTRFSSQSLKPGLSLFVLQPFTGKTHQLRVAMKSIGSPPALAAAKMLAQQGITAVTRIRSQSLK